MSNAYKDNSSTKTETQKETDIWSKFPEIKTKADYIKSLKNREVTVWLQGKKVEDITSHPIIKPSINAMAASYELQLEDPELAAAHSEMAGGLVNRFTHVATSAQDLVDQNKMQRKLGQITGTCFQRCVGMDAINSLHSVTYEMDEAHNTNYHIRFLAWLKNIQQKNLIVGGAMTDPKGDRSLAPHQQKIKDVFVHVTKRDQTGVWISGAKAHQTGCINSHWLVVMPTMRLAKEDAEFAVVGALPADSQGISYIYGRQSCDLRSMEEGDVDSGNSKYAGQEALIIFENVFIPNDFIFMDGEFEFAATLVDRFTAYHRRSYVCKTGLGDALIGAAAAMAEYNGVPNVSHINDKLVEMAHLNETIFGTGIAASYSAKPQKSGVYQADPLLANICKHNVTRMPYEISRLAQDIAGGLLVTLPHQDDFKNPVTADLLEKLLSGASEFKTEDRARMLRLIENLTMGRGAVGYLTESMHGAGSPQAQRIQIKRAMNLPEKKRIASKLAGIDET